MKKNILIALATTFSLSLLLIACSKDDDNASASNPRVSFQLTDAPGDYEEVNVDVVGLRVHISGASKDSSSIDSLDNGWIDLPLKDTIYNLIHLRDSSINLINEFEVPNGKINQLRLILGDSNTVKLEGDSVLYNLDTPSAMQSGLKINLQTTLESGSTNDFTLDFDAEKSVLLAGGTYKLKPTIKVIKN